MKSSTNLSVHMLREQYSIKWGPLPTGKPPQFYRFIVINAIFKMEYILYINLVTFFCLAFYIFMES